MNTNKINILFLIERTKLNKQGQCPLRCRITYLGKRKVFATGHFVFPDQWDSKHQKVYPITV
jgi:hypothetical protein